MVLTSLLPEPTLVPRVLSPSYKVVNLHPVKVFRSNVTPTAGMIQQLPCGKVDCEDGCWESKQARKGEGLAMAIAEGSAIAREGVQVLEGDKATWENVKRAFKYDGPDTTFGVKFPRTADGQDRFTLIMVSKRDLDGRAGLTRVAELSLFEPYARACKAQIGTIFGENQGQKPRIPWSGGFPSPKSIPNTNNSESLIPNNSTNNLETTPDKSFDFRKIPNLVDTRSSEFQVLVDLTVAFSLAQDRQVQSQGRSAYITGINRFTSNPQRRFCRGDGIVHSPAWVWNAQVKRGDSRVCRWCGTVSSTPWRALKSGTKVRSMSDALAALRPFGVRGHDDSTFCYFHILPGQSDLEIENVLALYGSDLGQSFRVVHDAHDHEPTNSAVLDLASPTL